jgi:hypothetical protein
MLTVNVTEAIRLHQKAKAAVDALGPRESNEAFERACAKEQGALRLIERASPRDLQETLQRVTYLDTYWQVYGEGLCTTLQGLARLQR